LAIHGISLPSGYCSENYSHTKVLLPIVVRMQQAVRNLADIRVFGDSNGGQRVMIDFEGWDMGYADARNGQPSQCPPNVDPISYLGGYREGCSADPAHASVLARIRRGLNR
jgi:hypothetical protein